VDATFLGIELSSILLLVLAGFGCGVVNALAGGGSFLTFPLLLFLGLPPQVANATNRIAIILQCAAGVATYTRHRVLPWRDVWPMYVPTVAGALLGSLLASRLDDAAFRTVTAVLLVAVAGAVFIDPRRWQEERPEAGHVKLRWYPVLFLIAAYGGFLQIGVGMITLPFLLFAGGYDVVRSNAIKFGLVVGYQLVALLVFGLADQVSWTIGLILAAGSIAGGAVGAHLVVRKGTKWVRYVVLVAALTAVAKLILDR
jgi:hypothetical protein